MARRAQARLPARVPLTASAPARGLTHPASEGESPKLLQGGATAPGSFRPEKATTTDAIATSRTAFWTGELTQAEAA